MEQSSSSCSYSYSLSSLGESSDNNKYTTDNIEEAIEEMESSTKEFMNRQREDYANCGELHNYMLTIVNWLSNCKMWQKRSVQKRLSEQK